MKIFLWESPGYAEKRKKDFDLAGVEVKTGYDLSHVDGDTFLILIHRRDKYNGPEVQFAAKLFEMVNCWKVFFSGLSTPVNPVVDKSAKYVDFLNNSNLKVRLPNFISKVNTKTAPRVTESDIYYLLGFNPELELRLSTLNQLFIGSQKKLPSPPAWKSAISSLENRQYNSFHRNLGALADKAKLTEEVNKIAI